MMSSCALDKAITVLSYKQLSLLASASAPLAIASALDPGTGQLPVQRSGELSFPTWHSCSHTSLQHFHELSLITAWLESGIVDFSNAARFLLPKCYYIIYEGQPRCNPGCDSP